MPQLSIVVPTFNERANVGELVARVGAALPGIDWEIVFVDDDSPDGTAERLRELAQSDTRVRCLLRIGRRGLASACLEGLLSTSSPAVAVMDADLQHDETRLPQMLALLHADCAGAETDIVVASRYAEHGSIGDWHGARARLSRLGTRLSRLVLRAELSDPMSGFFMMRREPLLGCIRAGVAGVGFKILLDLFAASPRPLRLREVPYTFGQRVAGHSKLDSTVAWEFGIMLLDRLFGHRLPIRFIAFSLVGAIGMGVHLLALAALYKGESIGFVGAQGAATLIAMSSNFVLNNWLTYRDMRLRGWQLVRGWASFVAACSVGAFANVGIAAWLFDRHSNWVSSAVVGVLVGAVWNYAVTAVVTWKKPGAKPARHPATASPAARPGALGVDAPASLHASIG